jgi:hypothetical protein
MPPTPFFLKKNAKKKTKKIYKYTLGWPNHPIGGGQPPVFCFFGIFFFRKKNDGGILGINRPNRLNCHNLKVWGGKVSHFKL